jgi:hypothetical protein
MPNAVTIQWNPGWKTTIAEEIVIPSGQSQSDLILLSGGELESVQMPSGWDAAALTLLGSNDGTNYFPVTNGTAEVSLTVAASQTVLVPAIVKGVRFLKLRSGVAATPVNQTANRTFVVTFSRSAPSI